MKIRNSINILGFFLVLVALLKPISANAADYVVIASVSNITDSLENVSNNITDTAENMLGINDENNKSVYVDPKTGDEVTAIQYNIAVILDALKNNVTPVIVILFIAGFLFRRINHTSATLRKIAFVLDLWLPLCYGVLVIVACLLADKFFW